MSFTRRARITPTQAEQNLKLKTRLARRVVEEGWTKRIPPDPEEMNELRGKWGGAAVRTFTKLAGESGDENAQQNLSDLLGDLMHWADRQQHVNFAEALERACSHYDDETRAER